MTTKQPQSTESLRAPADSEFLQPMIPRPFLALTALTLLAACGGVPEQPSFYRDLAQPGATLDAAAAASMISGYRANNNLPAVTVDPALMFSAAALAS